MLVIEQANRVVPIKINELNQPMVSVVSVMSVVSFSLESWPHQPSYSSINQYYLFFFLGCPVFLFRINLIGVMFGFPCNSAEFSSMNPIFTRFYLVFMVGFRWLMQCFSSNDSSSTFYLIYQVSSTFPRFFPVLFNLLSFSMFN